MIYHTALALERGGKLRVPVLSGNSCAGIFSSTSHRAIIAFPDIYLYVELKHDELITHLLM